MDSSTVKTAPGEGSPIEYVCNTCGKKIKPEGQYVFEEEKQGSVIFLSRVHYPACPGKPYPEATG